MSSTRRSGGRPRTSGRSDREEQQGEENRANRHQGHHSREYREEYYRNNEIEEPNNNSVPIVPQTVTPMGPAILRPSIIRHSVTGLRIPRVGSVPTSTLEMRMSSMPQGRIHDHQRHGFRLTETEQSTPTTSIDETVTPIEPSAVSRTMPTATITRADMEEGAGLGSNSTSDEEIINLTSGQESNDEQVTEGYSDDPSVGAEQIREENEDMWYIGEYEVERSPTPQLPSPGPVVPHRPAGINDILENHPDTEQPIVSIREIGIEALIGLRTEGSNQEEPIGSPDSNVVASTSDNKKRKAGDILETTGAKCSKSEIPENLPPPMRPLPARANNATTAQQSNRPYCLVVATPRTETPNRWPWHSCQEFNCGLISNDPSDRADHYLNHMVCPYRPTGWFQAPYPDDRNLIIRDNIFTQVYRDNPYFRYQIRDIDRRIRELLVDYSPFLIENGRFSNVSYEINTSNASTSHSRYILHVSVQFIMISDRDETSDREYDRDPIGIRFHEHYYIPLCNNNRGLTFNAIMKMLEEIREFMNTELSGG